MSSSVRITSMKSIPRRLVELRDTSLVELLVLSLIFWQLAWKSTITHHFSLNCHSLRLDSLGNLFAPVYLWYQGVHFDRPTCVITGVMESFGCAVPKKMNFLVES